MQEFAKAEITKEEIEKMKTNTYLKVFLSIFIITSVISYNLLINALTPEDVTLHFFKNNEYTEPASFETYIKDNGYEKVTAVFEKDSIHIEDVEKSYIKINDNTLEAYWDYHGYTPDNPEEKTIYYNGDKLYTEYKLNKIYDEQMYHDVTTKGDMLINYTLSLALSVATAFVVVVAVFDGMGLGTYIDNYYDKKYLVKL